MFGSKEIATVLALSSFPAAGYCKVSEVKPAPVSDAGVVERSARELPSLKMSTPVQASFFSEINALSMPSAKPFSAATSFEIAQAPKAPVSFATDNLQEVTSFIEKETVFTILGASPKTFKKGKPLAIIVADGGRDTEKKRDEYVDAIAAMVDKLKIKVVLIEEPFAHKRFAPELNQALKKVYTNPGEIELIDEIRSPLREKLPGRPVAGGEPSTALHIDLAIGSVLTVHTDALRKQIDQGDEIILVAGNEPGRRYEDFFKGIEYFNNRGGFPKFDPDKYCERTGFKSIVTKEGRELLKKDLEKIDEWVKKFRYQLRNQYVAGRVSKLVPGKEPNETVVLFYGVESVSASPVNTPGLKPGSSLQEQLNKKDVNCIIIGLRDAKAEQIKKSIKGE